MVFTGFLNYNENFLPISIHAFGFVSSLFVCMEWTYFWRLGHIVLTQKHESRNQVLRLQEAH